MFILGNWEFLENIQSILFPSLRIDQGCHVKEQIRKEGKEKEDPEAERKERKERRMNVEEKKRDWAGKNNKERMESAEPRDFEPTCCCW